MSTAASTSGGYDKDPLERKHSPNSRPLNCPLSLAVPPGLNPTLRIGEHMLSVPAPIRRIIPAVLLVVTGCTGSEITERTLVGTWRAKGSGTGMAMKIKSENPNAKSSEVLAAAKALSATSLEIKEGPLFTLAYGVNTYDGSWKFDKEAGFVELDVKTMNGEDADPKQILTSAFLGIIDRKDGTMRLFPGDRKTYEDLKQRNDKGADLLNVRLHKG
ncbi:MAG TPA: hypothetical protein VG826_31915 [Pirellulales bacterium]|nr:hypothetical protein [Pirellulales bacterium]